jgi:hypothetical protein
MKLRHTDIKRWSTSFVRGKEDECWIWMGRYVGASPTVGMASGSSGSAKRYAFFLEFGRMPQRVKLTMSCRNASCVNPFHIIDGDDAERFWLKVKILGKDDCWLWVAGTRRDGYGVFQVFNPHKNFAAHRFAFEDKVGPIPSRLYVCHRCDRKLCVNPSHLFLGTQKDNMVDAVSKGIMRKGSRHGMAKLTEDNIRDIRRQSHSGMSAAKIALGLKISPSNVRLILTGETWNHVQ